MISVNSASYVLPIRKDKIGKRKKEVELPELGRLVKVTPASWYGNTTVNPKKGRFIEATQNFLMFQYDSHNHYKECYLKSDLKLGLYKYEYIEGNEK